MLPGFVWISVAPLLSLDCARHTLSKLVCFVHVVLFCLYVRHCVFRAIRHSYCAMRTSVVLHAFLDVLNCVKMMDVLWHVFWMLIDCFFQQLWSVLYICVHNCFCLRSLVTRWLNCGILGIPRFTKEGTLFFRHKLWWWQLVERVCRYSAVECPCTDWASPPSNLWTGLMNCTSRMKGRFITKLLVTMHWGIVSYCVLPWQWMRRMLEHWPRRRNELSVQYVLHL